jgi:hypothetical protein
MEFFCDSLRGIGAIGNHVLMEERSLSFWNCVRRAEFRARQFSQSQGSTHGCRYANLILRIADASKA